MPGLDTSKAFYEPVGDDDERFVASELTRGPWDGGAQHAGPPSALIGRAIERMPTRDGAEMRLARITYEILRPIPIAPLRVETRVLRPGKRIELAEASMRDDDGTELVRATAWRIRVEDLPLPADAARIEHDPAPGPETGETRPFVPTGHEVGYHSAMETRFLEGAWREAGAARAWLRMRHPLVAGEEPSPLQRVLVAADTGNGISAILDWQGFVFINVELSVHLQRYPRGEWVLLDAATEITDDGIGRSDTLLSDGDGPIGRASQALLVDERP